MLAQLTASSALPKTLHAAYTLVLLPKGKSLPRDVPHRELLAAVLKRRNIKAEGYADAAVSANAADGSMIAARFLKRFVEHDLPWLHVDLSSSRCEGGLGSVASDVTGFGVAWGLRMLQAK